MSTEFQCVEMIKFENDGIDGCMTIWKYLMPLYCMLKMAKHINSAIYSFTIVKNTSKNMFVIIMLLSIKQYKVSNKSDFQILVVIDAFATTTTSPYY